MHGSAEVVRVCVVLEHEGDDNPSKAVVEQSCVLETEVRQILSQLNLLLTLFSQGRHHELVEVVQTSQTALLDVVLVQLKPRHDDSFQELGHLAQVEMQEDHFHVSLHELLQKLVQISLVLGVLSEFILILVQDRAEDHFAHV